MATHPRTKHPAIIIITKFLVYRVVWGQRWRHRICGSWEYCSWEIVSWQSGREEGGRLNEMKCEWFCALGLVVDQYFCCVRGSTCHILQCSAKWQDIHHISPRGRRISLVCKQITFSSLPQIITRKSCFPFAPPPPLLFNRLLQSPPSLTNPLVTNLLPLLLGPSSGWGDNHTSRRHTREGTHAHRRLLR